MVLVEEIEDEPEVKAPPPAAKPPAAAAAPAPTAAKSPAAAKTPAAATPPASSSTAACPEKSSPSAPSRWSAAFEAALHQILAEYEGQDASVRDGMESGMRKLFENPYHVELGTLLGGDPLSLEESQRIVFFPRLSDMRTYVLAFCRDTPEKTMRRERLMKFKLMSVFYTLHRRDGSLVDRFMHCGGLDSLVALVAEDHPVIQSQAVELLMEMLSPLMQLPHAGSLRQRHLHHQVFICLRAQNFWENLAKVVREPHEVFPNSHANCVRVLAGSLGWLRPEDGRAPAAGSPPDMREVVKALQHYLDNGPGMKPETRGLTEDLLQELQGVPTFRADPLPEGPDLQEARRELFTTEAETRESSAHAWQALRLLGNAAFKGGKIWPAETAYRLALEEGGACVPSSEASLIESNRALVLLKAGHPREAAAAAGNALDHNPSNAKAAFRQAQALLELHPGSPQGAQAASDIRRAVAAAELATELQPKDATVEKLLARARELAEKLPSDPTTDGAACAPTAEPKNATLDDMD